MGEFKAQILAVLLVLGIFTLLNSKFQSFFSEVWTKVERQVIETID